MAGGKHAKDVPCMVCMMDDGVLVKSTRIYEGNEDDRYRCTKGHEFGMDWRTGPATEPQWPPSADLIAEFGQPVDIN